MQVIIDWLRINWVIAAFSALFGLSNGLVLQLTCYIEFYVIWEIFFVFFDSYKFVVFLFSGNASHMFIKVIVYIFWPVTGIKSFLEQLMIILFLYFFFKKLALLVTLQGLLSLFWWGIEDWTFFGIRKVHLMKTLLLFFLLQIFLFPKNFIGPAVSAWDLLAFYDLSIFLELFS